MDHELKQRLIGAVVITALAAIFVPMLFDDPVDNGGKAVSELSIPQQPAVTPEAVPALPENKAQVLSKNETDLTVSEAEVVEPPKAEPETLDADNAEGTGDAQKEPSASKETMPEHKALPGQEAMTMDEPQDGNPSLDTGDTSEPAQEDVAPVARPKAEEKPKASKSVHHDGAKKPAHADKPKAKVVDGTGKHHAEDSKQKASAEKPKTKLRRYSVQAGSFSKKENAQALVEKLRKQGLPATLVSGGEYYRVKIGPALDKNKAKDMKSKLDKQNINSLLIAE